MKFEYRISKYNPIYRNAGGNYEREDWTSFSDIGKSFNGKIFDVNEYNKYEQAYIETALSFLKESKINKLLISDLENNHLNSRYSNLQNNRVLDSNELISQVIKSVLREDFWCKLINQNNFFIHFGYDYYMYIGTNIKCEKSEILLTRNNLFMENITSPYK